MNQANSKAKLTRSEAGRLGGSATSDAKADAARENGKLGGRPRKYATAAERQRAYLERKNRNK